MTISKKDLRKYVSGKFIKLSDVEGRTLALKIADVLSGHYDKPDLVFTTGQKLSLNKFNLGRLMNDLGDDPLKWIDADVEVAEGMIPNPNGEAPGPVISVLMPETKPAAKAADAKPKRGDMDDEIPF